MKKQLLFLLITILSINCYSQITFEKGYFITNSNEKVDCLIKNTDWRNNPTQFEYKLTDNSEKETETIKTVKEFGIYNVSKYSRHKVKIDRSSNQINKMSNTREAILQEEELFLKVLIEGKASLYLYEDGELKRFFYSKEGSEIEQLIFKEYLKPKDKIATNNRYKQQLWNDLKCSTFKISKVEKIDYKEKELVNFFVKYNECNNQEFTNFNEKQKRDLFNLNIRFGFNNSSLLIQDSYPSTEDLNFDNTLGFRLGIETEFIMPFNKNKWAVILEPTYQYFKSEGELGIAFSNNGYKVDYKSIELPIGIRHYFFLNENSKIFVNSSFIIDVSLGSSVVDTDFRTTDFKITTRNNLAFGLGYKYNDKYSLEFRYHTNREILSDYISWRSYYKTVSVIFGYSLF